MMSFQLEAFFVTGAVAGVMLPRRTSTVLVRPLLFDCGIFVDGKLWVYVLGMGFGLQTVSAMRLLLSVLLLRVRYCGGVEGSVEVTENSR